MSNHPILSKMDMQARTKRPPRQEELGRWRREIEGPRDKRGWRQRAALTLANLLSLVVAGLNWFNRHPQTEELLDGDDVDAVVIATPHHALHATSAGHQRRETRLGRKNSSR
ncbi:MAG: hypothetical protein GY832_11100 [Chloroflexi bacterium]|nr:hypothetical protein [Chloroflexota bacterium]